MTPQITTARLVVPEDAPRTVWMLERGEGVTASDAWKIARAGIKARRAILEQKMNGSTFRGNKATNAGHAREAALLDEAAEHLASLTPNGALWGAVDNDLLRATPDAIGIDQDGALVVVEVKSHEFGWESERIPVEHMAQMQFQIHVLGAEYALYGFEVRDENDMPPIGGATWIPVPRDDEMIAWLVERAESFIAWRDAGCPDVDDDLPAEVAEVVAEWAPLKRDLEAAIKAEKAANDKVKAATAQLPGALRFGTVGMTEHGGFQTTVSESTVVDDAAWKAAAPEVHGHVEMLRVELALLEATALKHFPRTTRKAPALKFQEVEHVD